MNNWWETNSLKGRGSGWESDSFVCRKDFPGRSFYPTGVRFVRDSDCLVRRRWSGEEISEQKRVDRCLGDVCVASPPPKRDKDQGEGDTVVKQCGNVIKKVYFTEKRTESKLSSFINPTS